MKPYNPDGHQGYCKKVLEGLRKHNITLESIPKVLQELLNIFFALDLSWIDTMMQDKYSIFGPAPRLPSCMVRSVMLSYFLRIQQYSDWALALKTSPLYAIISGFEPGDVPGHSTFYDFETRMWDGKNSNTRDHLQSKKKKPKKPANPSDKAEPPEGRDTAVSRKIREMEKNPVPENPDYKSMFELYTVFLRKSHEMGLIDLHNLTLCGDGTEIITASHLNYKKICDCAEKGILHCDCPRYYSQPDTDWGYDSHRKMHYAGYNAYLGTARNLETKKELPVFGLLFPASTHDSVALIEFIETMEKLLPECNIRTILLDSAHDSQDEAEFLESGRKPDGTPRKLQSIVDLNPRRGISYDYKGCVVHESCTPVCPAGHEMTCCGSDYTNRRTKYTCPLFKDPSLECACGQNCPYATGIPLYTLVKDNPRLFSTPARSTNAWDKLYNNRTASERINSLLKGDAFDIEETHRHSSKAWYFVLFMMLICIHVRAWHLEEQQAFTKMVS